MDMASGKRSGLTLLEVAVSMSMLAVGVAALLGGFSGQMMLTEHSRNLSLALNDAERVMEQIRQHNQNGCTAPSVLAPVQDPGTGTRFASWDAWLADAGANGGGGKSLRPDSVTMELVPPPVITGTNPLDVTVLACWVHRGRVIGECRINGTQLEVFDVNGDGTLTSPVMVRSEVTCRP